MSSNDSNAYDFLAKVLILGETGVGKTSIVHRYCNTCFCCSYNCTLGMDFKMKTIQVDEKKVKLQIWDTAVHPRFPAITQTYYRGAVGIILCYAINNRESFEKIGFWMEEVKKYAHLDVYLVLVGTKSDLLDERVVSIDEGRKLAESYGMKFFETSAKKYLNIDEVFLALTRDVMKVFGDKKNSSGKLQLRKKKSEVKDGGPRCF